MNIFDDFNSTIDNAAIDPRPALKAKAKYRYDRLMGGVAPEIAEALAKSFLRELAVKAVVALENGHWDQLNTLLSNFSSSLSTALSKHRKTEITPESEITKCREMRWFEKFKWNGHETGCLLELLKLRERETGERESVESVGYRSIKTDRRTIDRNGFDALRPISQTAEFFRSLGTSEQTIAAAEAMERRESVQEARPFRNSSGPMQSLKGRFGQ